MTPIEQTKALRKELQLSQAQFAARFGIPPQTYAQWENGRRKPDTTSELWLRTIVLNQVISEYIARLSFD